MRVGYANLMGSTDKRYIAACSGLAKRLKRAQKQARKIDYRGGKAGISCDKCDRHWKIQYQYSLNGWYWPGDLAHNVRKHRVMLPPAFIKFLFTFGKLSSAERKLEKRL